MSMSDMITPPEPTKEQIRQDIQDECKRYVLAKETIEGARIEIKEQEESMKNILENLRCNHDLEDLEKIETIAADRDFV